MRSEKLVERFFGSLGELLLLAAAITLSADYFHHDPRHDVLGTWALLWHLVWDVLLMWGVFACLNAVFLLLLARYYPTYFDRRTRI